MPMPAAEESQLSAMSYTRGVRPATASPWSAPIPRATRVGHPHRIAST